MLFNSYQFLIFFSLVTAVYFLLKDSRRTAFLLFASCVFYMAFVPEYILILGATILVDYFAGIWIERTAGRARRGYLIFSVLTTCFILFFFKYFNFAADNLAALLGALGVHDPVPKLDILLPIGLSFHTFQSLSYVFEVYYGRQKAEKDFLTYSLYVMFYPQLVAGPIERPQNLLHQFREHHSFDIARICDGLRLMMWGLFKKVVIADRLSIFVNHVFKNPEDARSPALAAATVFFAFQIYCDFSGYSDMAIGAARVMGFRLMKNFEVLPAFVWKS